MLPLNGPDKGRRERRKREAEMGWLQTEEGARSGGPHHGC